MIIRIFTFVFFGRVIGRIIEIVVVDLEMKGFSFVLSRWFGGRDREVDYNDSRVFW